MAGCSASVSTGECRHAENDSSSLYGGRCMITVVPRVVKYAAAHFCIYIAYIYQGIQMCMREALIRMGREYSELVQVVLSVQRVRWG